MKRLEVAGAPVEGGAGGGFAAGNEAEEAEPLQQGAAGGEGALVASGGRPLGGRVWEERGD